MTTPIANQEIYERIYAAIGERRLPAGTKLSEEKLAAAFHVSRTRVREVLFRLSQEFIVELIPNRGAFVAKPTEQDMKNVFAVRRTLERAIVQELATQHREAAIPTLKEHLEQEKRARQRRDRTALAKLTGDFHVRLAELTDNWIYVDSLRRLVALTGLIISLFDSPTSTSCPDHEHEDIVGAIERGDAATADKLLLEHLQHVEQGLRPSAGSADELDFGTIFGLAPSSQNAPPR